MIGRLKNNLLKTYAHIHTDSHRNWPLHTRRARAHTNTDNHHAHTQRQQRLSRLVAVLPPPGTINVSSHLVTTRPRALAEDEWRSMDGEKERDCVLGLKLAMIPPSRFCKGMQSTCKHTCMHKTSTHKHAFYSPLSLLPSAVSNNCFCR